MGNEPGSQPRKGEEGVGPRENGGVSVHDGCHVALLPNPLALLLPSDPAGALCVLPYHPPEATLEKQAWFPRPPPFVRAFSSALAEISFVVMCPKLPASRAA